MNRKIIIFLPSFESGGVERNAVYFANVLSSHGFVVHLLYCRKSDKWFSQLDERVKKVKITRIMPIPFVHERLVDALSMLIFSFPILKQIRGSDPAAMIGFQSNVVAIFLAHIARVRIAVRISNHFYAAEHERGLLRKLAEIGKKWTYKYSDIVIANSHELANDYQPVLGKKIDTIFNPIDFRNIDLLRQAEVKDKIFTNKSCPIVISAGRLAEQKNYTLLINAMTIVMKVRACNLVILGEGEQRNQLAQLARALGIGEFVHFLGYQANVYKYFNKSDLFVLSSNYEGMPNVLIEAVACGLPVVSTQCKTGPSEILCDGDGGELVPTDDCDALAEGILRSLNNPDDTRRKCQVAQNNLLRFDLEVISKDYIRLATTLLGDT